MINSTDILLAKEYHTCVKRDVSEYIVTVKYDGVRAVWDGTQFITRQGNVINAPEWFTKNLPKTILDGELWAGNGKFDIASATIRRSIPNDDEWSDMTYVVFDNLSDEVNVYIDRLSNLFLPIVDWSNGYNLRLPEIYFPTTDAALLELLDEVIAKGGEGLMLRRKDSMHPKGRSSELLKLKKTSDAEATVVGYEKGKDRKGKMVGGVFIKESDLKL